MSHVATVLDKKKKDIHLSSILEGGPLHSVYFTKKYEYIHRVISLLLRKLFFEFYEYHSKEC